MNDSNIPHCKYVFVLKLMLIMNWQKKRGLQSVIQRGVQKIVNWRQLKAFKGEIEQNCRKIDLSKPFTGILKAMVDSSWMEFRGFYYSRIHTICVFKFKVNESKGAAAFGSLIANAKCYTGYF